MTNILFKDEDPTNYTATLGTKFTHASGSTCFLVGVDIGRVMLIDTYKYNRYISTIIDVADINNITIKELAPFLKLDLMIDLTTVNLSDNYIGMGTRLIKVSSGTEVVVVQTGHGKVMLIATESWNRQNGNIVEVQDQYRLTRQELRELCNHEKYILPEEIV